MIENQKHLFDIPEGVTYLNCASQGPFTREVLAIGEKALRRKLRPWDPERANIAQEVEGARAEFARLVGAEQGDIAVQNATSYGAAVAAANLKVGRYQSIVVLEGQFPSNYYIWHDLAERSDARLVTVSWPADGDWTAAVCEAIQPDTAIAALPPCHWTDGSALDLVAVGARCREVGAQLFVDATQAAGAMALDVKAIGADFLVCSGYKWLLSPYTLAYFYAAPHRQEGRPIEMNANVRAGGANGRGELDYDWSFRPGARRYDMGERDNMINLPMSLAALKQLNRWGVDAIARTLRTLTDRIAGMAEERQFKVPPSAHRVGHYIGIRSKDGFTQKTVDALAAKGVHTSFRGGAIRVSPHLFNDAGEIDRLFQAIDEAR